MMERVTIATAIHELEEILLSMDDAYWEASTILTKDSLYDLISTLHGELNELAKLSIEDHYMAYEPITSQFRHANSKLKELHNTLAQVIQRSKTAETLREQIPEVVRLLSPCS